MQRQRGISVIQFLVGIAVIGAAVFFGLRHLKSPAASAVSYRTAGVTRGTIVQQVTANGALSPVRNVEVGSQISGTITEIKVDFNSKVQEGEVVAQIDPATYERSLLQAEAELANANAAEELAQLEFERAARLLEDKVISKAEYDLARINLSQAKATVQTRAANVERARVDLSRTTIYAPMDGMVITRKVEVGQTVAASMNTPTLFVIANDLKKMRIEAAVSEADVGGVEEGQLVQFDVDAFPGRQFEGRVEQVRFAPTTNQNVVSYATIVSVSNDDLKLRPGMTANAKIITAERRDVLKVPNAALRFKPPEDATVISEAPADAGAPSTTARPLIESGPFAGLPEMPWQTGGERRRPTDDERTAYVASLTSEQKQQYEQALAAMRARMAQAGGIGGGGGSGGGGEGFGSRSGEGRRAPSDAPKSGTVYIVDKEAAPGSNSDPVFRQVTVKLGISDGASTEILDGLKEGDMVGTGFLTATPVPAATGGGPLGNPFSRGGRPR